MTRSPIVQKSDGEESLEALEQAPDQDPEVDEAKRHKDKVNAISDDVNGLSLSDKQSSYVGVSSISAALKVIFKTAPIARPFIAQVDTAPPSRSNTPPPHARDVNPYYLPPADVGHKMIESYFNHVHVLMPMIDEDQFWHTYLYGQRRDSPWLALLNVVLSLGSLSSSTCENEEHVVYFQRGWQHLDLETFGSSNLLILQALGLLSGYYLHWLNRPNEANCIMGATLRMATQLGLHREYSDGQPRQSSSGQLLTSSHEVPVEIRRRTWWSLFVLDAWGSTTTGRPSLGRMGPGVTVQSPRIPEQMNNAQYLASLRLLPIIHNIEFCKLATRIQDTLAARSLLKFEELFALDAELVKWHEDLPPMLRDLLERPQMKGRNNSGLGKGRPKSVTPSAASAAKRNPFDFSQPPDRDHTQCPDVLKTPRAIMHWRYQNLRMLMHRPFLLAAALRKTPYANMGAEEKVAVGRCRLIAGQTISDINQTCRDELIAGWNAVWLMYQAVMVPLVSLFSYLSSPTNFMTAQDPSKSPDTGRKHSDVGTGTDEDVDKWRNQIQTATKFFDRMRRYSIAAKKSKDVVQGLYDASIRVAEYNEQQRQQRQQQSRSRRHLSSPRPMNLGPFDPALTNPYQSGMQDESFSGQPVWGLTPNGDFAMNVFWDDMMWETFPDVPEEGGYMPGMEGFDWIPPDEQNLDQNTDAQDWSQWRLNEQQ